MMPARIDVDFIPRRRRFSLPGVLLLSIGTMAALWTYADFRDTSVATEITTMKLSRLTARVPQANNAPAEVDTQAIDSASRRLATPWSRLLEDLELAATDSDSNVALLGIAPDTSEQSVRVSGEARSLPHVIDYVARLQTAESLRHPLLENHEIQVSDRDRPVRFVVLADWRLPQ